MILFSRFTMFMFHYQEMYLSLSTHVLYVEHLLKIKIILRLEFNVFSYSNLYLYKFGTIIIRLYN